MRIAVNALLVGCIVALLTFHVETVLADRYMQTAIRQSCPAPHPPLMRWHRSRKYTGKQVYRRD